MFLKMDGVTGHARDADFKGAIEVVSWSWGLQAPSALPGQAPAGRAALSELVVVKRVDQSSPTLMQYLRNHKIIPTVSLSVRKAGTTPLEYYRIELTNARLTSLTDESENADLTERLRIGFAKVKVSYIPQSNTGARGGGEVIFEADAHAGT
jgi:type VI secretion system secreted protein Hcp